MLSRNSRSLVTVALGHTTVELCSQFLPVIYPLLISSMDLNYTKVGVLALVASTGTALAQPLFGYLADTWGPRRQAALSVAWIGLLMGLVGWMGSYAGLALIIGLGVLGSAAFHPPGATIASSGAGERRGAAVSVFSVGGSLGSALSPLLITASIGWLGMRGTAVLIPIALLCSLVLYWQLGRARDAGGEQTTSRQSAGGGDSVRGLILVVMAVMCLAWFQWSFRTYLPIWIESQSRSLTASSRMFFLLQVCMGCGSLIGGALSDRVGRWQLLALSLGLLAPVVWFFVGAAGAWQWVLLGTMGILLGATFPVSIVMAQESWSRGVGIASGLAMGIGWLPGGVGASFTGYIADRFSLEVGLRALVVPALLGLVCVLGYASARQRTRDESGGLVPV